MNMPAKDIPALEAKVIVIGLQTAYLKPQK